MFIQSKPNPVKNLFNPLLCMALVACLFSCKKEKKQQPDPTHPAETCVVTKYTDFTGTSYTIQYENGLIKSVTGSNGLQRNFIRRSDTIFIESKSTDLHYLDTVTLNSRGMILSLYSEELYNQTRERTIYKYGTDDQLERTIQLNDSGKPVDSTMYTWKNGNLISTTNATPVNFHYSYYEDMNITYGDLYQFNQYVQFGGISVKNKNPMKSQSYINPVATTTNIYLYTLENKKAKSIKLKQTTAGSTDTTSAGTWSFTYDCH